MPDAITAVPDSPSASARAAAEIGVDQLSLAVLAVDSELRLRYFNPAASQIAGLSNEHGQLLGDCGPAGRLLTHTARRALADDQPVIQRSLQAGRNGETQYYDVIFTPGLDAAGERQLVIELFPVAARGQLDVSLQEVLQQTVVERLSRGLAHEIKNPLGGLRGAAQLLQASVDDELKEYTGVIVAEVDRIARLIDDLQKRHSPADHTPVNLYRVLDRVRQLVLAEYPGLRIARDFDPSIPNIMGSSDALVQGFLNLLVNAAQAGARTICLRTRVRRGVTLAGGPPTSVVAVEVVDDGPGVPEELREVIFYPLISGRDQGSGLGLSIAQSIAVSHGGVIRLHRQAEHTVFQWLIPLTA